MVATVFFLTDPSLTEDVSVVSGMGGLGKRSYPCGRAEAQPCSAAEGEDSGRKPRAEVAEVTGLFRVLLARGNDQSDFRGSDSKVPLLPGQRPGRT